jgi:hypothetical protein
LNASVGRNYLSAPNPINEQALGHAVVLVYLSAAKASPTELSCLTSLPREPCRGYLNQVVSRIRWHWRCAFKAILARSEEVLSFYRLQRIVLLTLRRTGGSEYLSGSIRCRGHQSCVSGPNGSLWCVLDPVLFTIVGYRFPSRRLLSIPVNRSVLVLR